MAAAHYRLDNLTFLIDHNGLQIDGSNVEVMSLGDLKKKFESFGFITLVVENGNDVEQILAALDTPVCNGNHAASFVKRLKARAYPSWKIKWAGMARHQMKSSAGRRSGNWGNKA